MSTTKVQAPTSRLRFGHAQADVTPPGNIYHRMWGAARHDAGTGVHAPIIGDVMVLAPIAGDAPAFVRAQFDMVGLGPEDHELLHNALAEGADVPSDHVIIGYSHTHSGGFFSRDRVGMPGGDLIIPYLEGMFATMRETAQRAAAAMQPATITWAAGWSNMAYNRDYWDENMPGYACGFNPDAPFHDQSVTVGRVTDDAGEIIAMLVSYSSHATTLAYDNSLVSPDYIGGLREVVQKVTGKPAVFLLGASGDQAPKDGYLGDTKIADKNGRQVGYAALSALESMGPAGTDFHYAGYVISGATLGTWRHVPFGAERQQETSTFAGGSYAVPLPLREAPDPAQLTAEMEDWLAKQAEADQRGDTVAARDYGARAERARRWLGRIDGLPKGETYPVDFSVLRLGDAILVSVAGEPYNLLQTELRRRFPDYVLIASPLAKAINVAYLLPEDRYGKGLYQEEPSLLAKGCLEKLIDAVTEKINAIV